MMGKQKSKKIAQKSTGKVQKLKDKINKSYEDLNINIGLDSE